MTTITYISKSYNYEVRINASSASVNTGFPQNFFDTTHFILITLIVPLIAQMVEQGTVEFIDIPGSAVQVPLRGHLYFSPTRFTLKAGQSLTIRLALLRHFPTFYFRRQTAFLPPYRPTSLLSWHVVI